MTATTPTAPAARPDTRPAAGQPGVCRRPVTEVSRRLLLPDGTPARGGAGTGLA